jgi:hypothetical protein
LILCDRESVGRQGISFVLCVSGIANTSISWGVARGGLQIETTCQIGTTRIG